MLCSDSRVDRSASVSSMRSTNVPSLPCASSQLKSAVRALPTCSWPVGLGANLTRILQSSVGNRQSSVAIGSPSRQSVSRQSSVVSLQSRQQCDGVGGDGLASSDGVDALVRFCLHADPARIDCPARRRVEIRWRRGAARSSGARGSRRRPRSRSPARVRAPARRLPRAARRSTPPSIADRYPDSAGRCRRPCAAPRIASVTA